MLGEDHSLLNEFPEHKDKIAALVSADSEFATDTKQYNLLDSEIRNLELNNAPIDDEAFHQMKHDRAVLKDKLYQQLVG
ncbi:YdcH family protein [Paraglaciecola aquimarina]|uniref:YdcH family protein n=1 Tax=Paraglaciecola aquimarina TaxID=1235557 RepID=A0ABU3SU97_9ALTE|nr:YdcH family protein [Paraglaciecola aquimarina]MDU0353532.1 YdcH family protein [Paraglaciecola aquimarina]